jgi:AAA domain-containing protein
MSEFLPDWEKVPEPAVENHLFEKSRPLPPIEDGTELIYKPIILPADVIEGVLHRGGKMVLGGASKSYKTWMLTDIAASVTSGTVVLGRWPTKRGRVLYINLEIQRGFFAYRLKTVCDERQIKLDDGYLHVWNLRGHAADLSRLLPQILLGIGENQYDLIIIDPIYKVLGLRNENDAGDVATLLNEIESLAVQTEAAVAFGAHYSKGNQSGKDPMDRVGGSGVFARDPDSILNFTKHQEKNCFTVDAILRNHPPVESFVVRWEFPLFVVDSLLDPAQLKQVGNSKSKDEPKTKEDLLALVPEEGSIAKNILIRHAQARGMGVNRARDFLSELVEEKELFEWRVKRPRTNPEVRISRREQALF